MNYTKQKAFTLVELIVVVTILAILATIGFVSYSSYLTGVRDTNRMAQLVSIHDGLTLYSTKNSLPLPDDSIEILNATDPIAYQGYAGANTLETIDFTKGGKDPRDGSYFSYYLTKDRKHFQLLAFLEEEIDSVSSLNSTNITSSLRPSDTSLYEGGNLSSPSSRGMSRMGQGELGLMGYAQAVSYDNRIATTYGKELGILTDMSNLPAQEIPAISSAGELELTSTTNYKAHFSDDNIYAGSGAMLAAKVLLNTEHVSGFEPSDVSGLYMWFDANDATTIEKTTGNVITKWNDKSNNNNDMDVVEGNPTYGDYSINGSKTVYFDGDDSLHTTATFDAPYTIMYVAQLEGSLNRRALGGDGNDLIGLYNGYLEAVHINGWIRNSLKLDAGNTDIHQYTFSRDINKDSEFFHNGEDIGVNLPTGGDTEFGSLWLGRAGIASTTSKVYLAEVIIFNRVISDSERKKIEAYLNKKWGPF